MTGPIVSVDTTSPVPPYEQVRAQLEGLIHAGVVAADQKLPPVRQLAADLGLAVGTVARAYRELEVAGLVTSRRGGGTRVASDPPRRPDLERARLLVDHANAFWTVANRFGATEVEAIAALLIVGGVPEREVLAAITAATDAIDAVAFTAVEGALAAVTAANEAAATAGAAARPLLPFGGARPSTPTGRPVKATGVVVPEGVAVLEPGRHARQWKIAPEPG